ncbi:hypothetical protein RBH26_06175 [Natronolimnohabitans sp. A-GB9]|uniref:hypothetical protein n=1 Tax=Natronolimnohabitans sp. A-GB9 TaxID=3069757 RepID=UPI0027B49E44|nr:hypothetical protein [Natronolimnohabitans sp. A-GB9]MDQ2050067.1 hypothetical protein [Natronolimnohabitans sp. A-GB9]
MDLTRRRLFGTLAAGSSTALVVGADAVSRAGVGHHVEVETSDDESYLVLEGDVLWEPVAESEATLTIDTQLEDATVATLEAGAFTFDPAPPFSLADPVTVEITLTDVRTGVVTDTVTVGLEGPDVHSAVERELSVEGTTAPES